LSLLSLLAACSLLREYLELEFSNVRTPGFTLDLERIVDDFVLFCMLIGNDFLPGAWHSRVRPIQTAVQTLCVFVCERERELNPQLALGRKKFHLPRDGKPPLTA